MDDPKDAKSFGPRSRRLKVARGRPVFRFLKEAVDDTLSDQRGKISAIGLLLFVMLDLWSVGSTTKAP